ncbi:MAG: branched-chain amino acid ABC transporter permease [bacterium]|nr:branched-chain amino acid ABC transporter permease [bacterium]
MASDVPSISPQNASPIRPAFRRIRRTLINDPIQVILYAAGGIFLLLLLLSAINTITSEGFVLSQYIRRLTFGLAQGSIYALVALGYTLVYGILGMINFAHGEVFMAGAYIGFFAAYGMVEAGWLQTVPLLVLLITLLVGMGASVVVAVLLERIAYRPLRSAPRLVPLITAIGASIFIQQLFLRLFGGSPRVYPDLYLNVPGTRGECEIVNDVQTCVPVDLIAGIYDVRFLGLELTIRPLVFIIFFLALALMGGLWLIVKRTKIGKAMRAVAEDKNTASLMGVNVDRVIVTTFVLGAALAGAAGVLFALYDGRATPGMGFTFGIKAFTAAVLGGIGNIPGAMAGGVFLGVIESVAPALLGIPQQLEDIVAFGMLVLILIFRPTGIFGEVLAKKKA